LPAQYLLKIEDLRAVLAPNPHNFDAEWLLTGLRRADGKPWPLLQFVATDTD